jgi:hypothetical protein
LLLHHQVRDVVEPSTKPGDSTLVLLGALTPLIRKLGPAADPANLKRLPIAAAAVWALYVGKCGKAGVLLQKSKVGRALWEGMPVSSAVRDDMLDLRIGWSDGC